MTGIIKKKITASVIAALTVCITSTSGFSEEKENNLISFFSSKAVGFESIDQLADVMEAAGKRRLVLMGEASHGTHEFYVWRSRMSRHLIEKMGFDFIAVEGDWASIYRLNKYVKNMDGALSSAREVLLSFDRWPQWMWSNSDILELAEWLRAYNDTLPNDEKIGFYGIDVYGQWEAMDDLIKYVRTIMPENSERIENKFECFSGYGEDEMNYARAVATGKKTCENELKKIVALISDFRENIPSGNDYAHFRALQNALVVKNAEEFYRLAAFDNVESWNSRVNHFWMTVQSLFDHYGEDSRGIVWAHNTHVGDARATPMAGNNQMNIGKLSRIGLGEENVYIIGFGTRRGTVNAGTQWGSPMRIMTVPDAARGSLDYFLGKVSHESFYLNFDEEDKNNPLLSNPLGHRAIGVTYNPSNERGNYVMTLPHYRYNTIIFFQETGALTPIQ